MKTLSEVSDAVSGAFEKRSRRMRGATYFVKIALIGVGTAIVTLSQFLALQNDEVVTHWHYVGVGAAVMVLVGVLFMIFSEQDPTEELIIARRAVEAAKELDATIEELWLFQDAADRTTELYAAFGRMRDVLERTAIGGFSTVEEVLSVLMTAAGRHLSLAMGFPRADQWTICVYQAEVGPAGAELACKAHERAIPCEINEARRWPVGVGVGGVAYANRSEIVVPDMHAKGIGSLYAVPGRVRPYDADRYRSIAVVPVMVGKNKTPWGVVIGTSSAPSHFSFEEDDGIEPIEGLRTLAGMVALVVALCGGAVGAPKGGSDRDPNNKPVSADS